MSSRILNVFILLMFLTGTTFAQEEVKEEAKQEASKTDATQSEVAQKLLASEYLLPATTKAWVSLPDIGDLDEQFLKTQIGQLSKDETFKPFIESIKGQFTEWLKQRNLRLGFKLENVRDVRTGEVCLAGIMAAQPQNNLGRGSHGLVFLVDVSETRKETEELLVKIETEMKELGATQEDMPEIHGAKIKKWKLKPNTRLKRPKFAYQTIANGWLLASDNESIFREVLRRLAFPTEVKKAETLGAQAAFKNIAEKTRFHENDAAPHIRWFIDPFGYVELAKAIADEEHEFKQRSNDWMGVLKKVGFDAIQGAGGNVSFSTKSHEILHRSFIYAPKNAQDANQQRVFGLFDFENKNKSSLVPPVFVGNSSTGYFGGTWDMAKAVKNVGHVVDAFLNDDGAFEKILNELEQHMDVDVKNVMTKFANEMIIVSESELPVSEESERVLFAIKLNGDAKFVFENFKRAWPDAAEIQIAGFNAIEIDTEAEEELPDDLFDDPTFGDDLGEEEEEQEPQFNLFRKRYIVVKDDYLFLTNNQDYMKQLVLKSNQTELRNASDFGRVTSALAKLSDEDKVSFRQFSRLDKALRTNYEMIRQGKMGASQTVLARILNQAFTPPNANKDTPRDQKIDGSKLPEDFEAVAKYLGPSGWVMESVEEGWLATGCVLKKQNRETIANKAEQPNIIRDQP